MKMQNSKKESILLSMILISFVLMLVIVFNELRRVEKPIIQPKPKIVLDEWVDNFDSTYIFNGCIHYTNKSI